MTKDIFYQYDFYTLEQKYLENEFIRILDEVTDLNESVEPFIHTVIDLIFKSIQKNIKKEAVPQVEIPQVDKIIADALKGNVCYDAYFDANPKNKLSEIVFKKFLSRVFGKDGFNDEKHIIQNYIHSWLEKRLALAIVKDKRFNSVEILTALIWKTEMLHVLYHYLVQNIPYNWIKENKKDWVTVSVSAENILDSVRTFDKEYFINYLELLKPNKDTELWEFINDVTHGSDYAMLNEEYSFKSEVLLKNDLLLWIEFWDNLNLPIIQDCMFTYFFESQPHRYLEVVDILVSRKINIKSDLNFLLLLIAKNYFDSSFKLTERLAFYEEEDRIKTGNESFFKAGQQYYKEWLIEKPNLYSILIKNLQTQLKYTDIEDWIFSYKPRRKNNNHFNKSIELYNTEIELLTDVYKSTFVLLEDFSLHSFNLQKFNFYAELIHETGKKHMAEKLLDTLFSYLTSDKFFWDKSFSEPHWSTLKGMSYLISLHVDPIQKTKELIDKFKVSHQGWKPVKIDYKPITAESFIYCGIGLIFEHPTAFRDDGHKELFFKELLDIILTQDRFSQIDNSDYYQQPLRILFLVANQVYPEVREYFEQELIQNYDSLFSLIVILTSDKDSISVQSKPLMAKRLENEFLIEKRKFNNKGQKQKISELEKLVTDLKLEQS